MKQLRSGSRGQAMVEYVMAVIMCIGVSVFISRQIKIGIGTIWKTMARNIAPGCPGCEPPSELQ